MTNKAGDCKNKHYYCPVHSTQFHFSPVQSSTYSPLVQWVWTSYILCCTSNLLLSSSVSYLQGFDSSSLFPLCIIQVGERDITVTLKAA